MSTKKHERPHTSHTEKKTISIQPPASAVQPVSDEERSRNIQIRAYDLWEQAGRPDGDVARLEYWCEAEQEITTAHAS